MAQVIYVLKALPVKRPEDFGDLIFNYQAVFISANLLN